MIMIRLGREKSVLRFFLKLKSTKKSKHANFFHGPGPNYDRKTDI